MDAFFVKENFHKKRNGLSKPFRTYFFEERTFEESLCNITNRAGHDKHYGDIGNIFWQVCVFHHNLSNRHFCNSGFLFEINAIFDVKVDDIRYGQFFRPVANDDFASYYSGFANRGFASCYSGFANHGSRISEHCPR